MPQVDASGCPACRSCSLLRLGKLRASMMSTAMTTRIHRIWATLRLCLRLELPRGEIQMRSK